MSDADSDLHVFTRCDFEGERSQNEKLEEGFLGCLANREARTRPIADVDTVIPGEDPSVA